MSKPQEIDVIFGEPIIVNVYMPGNTVAATKQVLSVNTIDVHLGNGVKTVKCTATMEELQEWRFSDSSSTTSTHRAKERLKLVDNLRTQYHWDVTGFHVSNYIVNLKRDGVKMNVYLSTGTVQTSMDHPTKGKTQLNRKRCSDRTIHCIFQNPRVHTKKGYHKKWHELKYWS